MRRGRVAAPTGGALVPLPNGARPARRIRLGARRARGAVGTHRRRGARKRGTCVPGDRPPRCRHSGSVEHGGRVAGDRAVAPVRHEILMTASHGGATGIATPSAAPARRPGTGGGGGGGPPPWA